MGIFMKTFQNVLIESGALPALPAHRFWVEHFYASRGAA
jgi:hypothetical protein